MKRRILVDFFDGVMWAALEAAGLMAALALAVAARYRTKAIDVGLGPECLINNVYHKLALQQYGYTAETYVNATNFITKQYDYVFSGQSNEFGAILRMLKLFWFACSRYRLLYIYFNGGPFYLSQFLWRFEPWLLQIARVKAVVMPYGGDVIDFTRSRNLLFKHAMTIDYPDFRLRKARIQGQIDLWTRHADHVISGCDWVDYLYHWDTLMIAHFSVDVDRLATLAETLATDAQQPAAEEAAPLRLLHAPNHQAVKGTDHLRRAVAELQAEGVAITLDLIEFAPNEVVLEGIARADVVVDQLIVGWYALFAIEAMAMAKPVVCFLRPDLQQLYTDVGLVEDGEIPLINARVATIKDVLRDLARRDRNALAALGQRSREYVCKHHSLDSVGKVFARINRSIGVYPSRM